MARFAAALALAVALAACAPVPQRAGVPTVWAPSPNFDERRPNFVILHHTTNASAGQSLAILSNPALAVSAHYLVARDGTIFQLVDERRRAWHAGESRWGAHADLNSASIGIEMDNDGVEPYPDRQVAALLGLLADLKARYRIPTANFLAHGDVAPGRKVDPGALFPWPTLAQRGFGLWCFAPIALEAPLADPLRGLQALGYDVTNPAAAIRAFNRHFLQDGERDLLDEEAQRTLQCLLAQPRGE